MADRWTCSYCFPVQQMWLVEGASAPPLCPSCNRAMFKPSPDPQVPTQIAQDFRDTLSSTTLLEEQVLAVMGKAFTIWKDRQAKYGPQNIAFTGALGCMIRAFDKVSRLRGVYLAGKGDTPDETINDSWLDLLNYALMGYLCHNNLWPGVDNADPPHLDLRTPISTSERYGNAANSTASSSTWTQLSIPLTCSKCGGPFTGAHLCCPTHQPPGPRLRPRNLQ